MHAVTFADVTLQQLTQRAKIGHDQDTLSFAGRKHMKISARAPRRCVTHQLIRRPNRDMTSAYLGARESVKPSASSVGNPLSRMMLKGRPHATLNWAAMILPLSGAVFAAQSPAHAFPPVVTEHVHCIVVRQQHGHPEAYRSPS